MSSLFKRYRPQAKNRKRHLKEGDLVKLPNATREKLIELYELGGLTKNSFVKNLSRHTGIPARTLHNLVSDNFDRFIKVEAVRKLEAHVARLYNTKEIDIDDPKNIEFLHARLISPYKKYRYPRHKKKTGMKMEYTKPRRACPFCKSDKRYYNIFSHMVRVHPDKTCDDYERYWPAYRQNPYVHA